MSDSREPCVCPAEHAGWLAMPGRRLLTNPRRILRGHLKPGDTALDLGCGPGFFTLPMAEMVGGGRFTAVDVQPVMLTKMTVRAARKGLESRILSHLSSSGLLGLEADQADFALAFWMVHEVPNPAHPLAHAHGVLKLGARMFIVEPRGRVGSEAFARTIELARAAGSSSSAGPRVFSSRSALLAKL